MPEWHPAVEHEARARLGFAEADAFLTMADLQALAGDLHERGMVLCVDLVLNHTAAEHEWARLALAGEPGYREMSLVYPDRAEPDAYERTLPEVFPGTAPGSFTEVPGLGWVWTTFHEYQWDLNYANPAVFRAMLGTMLVLGHLRPMPRRHQLGGVRRRRRRCRPGRPSPPTLRQKTAAYWPTAGSTRAARRSWP